MRQPIIEYKGEVLAKQGYGVHARQWLKGIVDDIKLTPTEDYLKPEQKLEDTFWIQQMVKSSIKKSPEILLNFSIPPNWQFTPDRFCIGCSLWEGYPYPYEWADLINTRAHALVVPSYGMKAALQEVTKLPIKVFKPQYDLKALEEVKARTIQGTEDKVRFFYSGDFNYLGGMKELIRGFNLAFGNQKDVVLIVKINLPTYTGDMQKSASGQLHQFLQGIVGIPSSNIKVITDNLTREEVASILKGCHYFVGLEKAIGIDTSGMMAEACGIPIISTELPGRDLVSLPVDSHRSPCLEYKAPLWNSRQWVTEPNMDSVIETLREAYIMYTSKKEDYTKLVKDLSVSLAWRGHDTDLLDICQSLRENKKKEAVDILSILP